MPKNKDNKSSPELLTALSSLLAMPVASHQAQQRPDVRCSEGVNESAENSHADTSLKAKIEGWAWSLPEHPKWQWLRDEMLSVARTLEDSSTVGMPRSKIAIR